MPAPCTGDGAAGDLVGRAGFRWRQANRIAIWAGWLAVPGAGYSCRRGTRQLWPAGSNGTTERQRTIRSGAAKQHTAWVVWNELESRQVRRSIGYRHLRFRRIFLLCAGRGRSGPEHGTGGKQSSVLLQRGAHEQCLFPARAFGCLLVFEGCFHMFETKKKI